MQVIMETTVATENAVYLVGKVYDLKDFLAKKWISRGLARELEVKSPIPIRNTSLPRK